MLKFYILYPNVECWTFDFSDLEICCDVDWCAVFVHVYFEIDAFTHRIFLIVRVFNQLLGPIRRHYAFAVKNKRVVVEIKAVAPLLKPACR